MDIALTFTSKKSTAVSALDSLVNHLKELLNNVEVKKYTPTVHAVLTINAGVKVWTLL